MPASLGISYFEAGTLLTFACALLSMYLIVYQHNTHLTYGVSHRVDCKLGASHPFPDSTACLHTLICTCNLSLSPAHGQLPASSS